MQFGNFSIYGVYSGVKILLSEKESFEIRLPQFRWLQTMGSSRWQTIIAGFAVLENAQQYDKIYQGRERQNICEKERTANGKKDAVWTD